MKKKIYALLMTMIFVLSLVACGGGSTTMDEGRDTNGMPGEPNSAEQQNSDSMSEEMKKGVDRATNAAEDMTQDAGNAAKKTIDEAQNAKDNLKAKTKDIIDNPN